jgi:membrane protein implicated in regulation of membrane protease activity
MTLVNIYLICFIVGFVLTVIAALTGTHDIHVPGLDGHGFHFHSHGHHGHAGDHGEGAIFSFGNIAAFMTWFGGTGYLLSQFSGVWFWLAFLVAIGFGLVGAALVFWLAKQLFRREKPMESIDYEMVGVLGKLTSAIREGGTGEMSFSRHGARRSAAARSDDGSAIERETEVFVTRYDKGIAYVRRWEEMSDAKENE